MQKSYCGSIESLDKRIALAAGEPDPSFGVAGSVVFGEGRNSTQAMAPLDDGRIVIAGSHDGSLSTGPFTRLRRFRGDGSADRTFDGDGQRTLDLLPGDETVQAIAAAGHGKLLLHVTGDAAGALVRLNANGSVDRAFGVNGKVISPLLDTPFYYDSFIRVPAGGKILVAQTYDTGGAGTFLGIRLLRFSDAGAADAGFGTNGIVETGQGSASHPTDLRIRRADGRITVGCSPYAGGASVFHFDSEGAAIGSVAVSRNVNGVKLLPNDRALVYYKEGNPLIGDVVVTRVLPNGQDDVSFGTNGSIMVASAGIDFFSGPGPIIRTDGKIVLISRFKPYNSPPQSNVYTFTADGRPDRTFDGDGVANIKHPSIEEVVVAATQLNNRILFAGGADFSIARITTGGKLDRSFSSDGSVLPDQFNGNFADSLPLADGRIVAVGYTGRVNPKLILTRFLDDGTIDTAFGTSSRDGFTEVSLPASVFGSAKLYRRGDGRIVVLAGESRIYRFTADGRLQTSYAFTPAEAVRRGDLSYTDLGWQADGKRLTVIYETNDEYPSTNAYLVRLNLNGSLDITFGNNGRIYFGADEGVGELLQMVQLSDGRMLIVSRSGYQVGLSRLLTNGQYDPSFNAAVISDYYGSGRIELDHLGRIVVRTDFGIHRRLPNGEYDSSFSSIPTGDEGIAVKPASVRVDSTGNIILAGSVRRFFADTTRFGIARFFGD